MQMEALKSLFIFSTEEEENLTEIKKILWRNFSAAMDFHEEIDVDFLNTISIFWLRAHPPSAKEHVTMGLAYICMMVFGIVGNSFVIYMFSRFRTLRTPSNALVINLAFSDLGMMAKIPMVIYNCFHHGPALGSLGCRLYGFIGGLTGTVSIATLTAIAIERHHAIVYPLSTNRCFGSLRVVVIFVWLYALFFSGIPFLDIGLGRYVPEGYLTCCSFDYMNVSPEAMIYLLVYFFFAWCLPFGIIAFCYIQILRAVAFTARLQSNKTHNKTEMKLSSLILVIIVLWFIAWTPYAVVSLVGLTKYRYHITPLTSMLPAFFCKSAACINPYVYSLSHTRFRKEIEKMLKNCGKTEDLRYTISFSRTGTRKIVRETSVSDISQDGPDGQTRY